jgi:hypothetical protein
MIGANSHEPAIPADAAGTSPAVVAASIIEAAVSPDPVISADTDKLAAVDDGTASEAGTLDALSAIAGRSTATDEESGASAARVSLLDTTSFEPFDAVSVIA